MIETGQTDEIGREHLQALRRVQDSLMAIQSADDRMKRDLDDIQKNGQCDEQHEP